MDDLLREFLTESAESIAQFDLDLVKLEQNPNDPGLLSNIFRLMHTIKGTCGFLGLPRLESVAHASENVLGKIRDGAMAVSDTAISLVLESLDRIKALLAELEANGAEPEGEDSDIIGRLNDLASGRTVVAPAVEAPVAVTPEAAPAAPAPEAASVEAQASLLERFGGEGGIAWAVTSLVQFMGTDTAFAGAYEAKRDAIKGCLVQFFEAVLERRADRDVASWRAKFDDAGLTPFLSGTLLPRVRDAVADLGPPQVVAVQATALLESAFARVADASKAGAQAPAAAAPIEAVTTAPPPRAAAPAPAPASAAPKAADEGQGEAGVAKQTIRVGVDVLENLMTLVGELVLTRNQLLQMVRKVENSEFTAPVQRLNHITSELQEGVMKTRMQPIGSAWSKLPRIIRDLSRELSKKIDLHMHGAETELDRQVLEMIRDPLTHMVRNSADHGVETPKDRIAAGKPETGRVDLNAYHEGGHIIIEVRDDGRGLPVSKLRKKIVDNGLVSEAEAAELSDQRIQQYIFHPGLSTAEKVTSVSGRGVGMDVVKTNIEKIGGTIELKSVEGAGTTFIIKIPLTLAIVSALIVECENERFAIPQISVVELVRAGGTSEHKVELISNTPVLRLRDRLLPLVSLGRTLQLAGEVTTDETREETYIVVAQVGAQVFGIIVDRVFDTEEIVVKPVAPILRDIDMFSGNTILGDGSIVMILDPNGVAARVGEVDEKATTGTADRVEGDRSHSATGETIAFLVFRAGSEEPKAVPLSLVARLEETVASSIEVSDGRYVMQYRGKLMPLVPFDAGYARRTEGRQPMLVFAQDERRVGLIVDEIVDIVEQRLEVQLSSRAQGVLGSAVIDGKATDVIDASHYLQMAYPDWFTARPTSSAVVNNARSLLLVDDSPFFRNLLAPLLRASGYTVTTAEDGDQALRILSDGGAFDAIISDIEMPGTDGYALARACRGDDRWRSTPMVALSSLNSPADIARGREAGFDEYVVKFDRDTLLNVLSQTLEHGAAA
jgi:two-component system chemotaxis sensor kinase CheA